MNKFLKTYISHRLKNEYFINDLKPFEKFLFPKLKERKESELIYVFGRIPEIIPHFLDKIILYNYDNVKRLNEKYHEHTYYNTSYRNMTRSEIKIIKHYEEKLKQINKIKTEISDALKNPKILDEVISKYGKNIVYSTFDIKGQLIRKPVGYEKFIYEFYNRFPEILEDKDILESGFVSRLVKIIIKFDPKRISDFKHFLNEKDKIGVVIQNPSLYKVLDVDLNKIIKTINNHSWVIEHLVLKSNEFLKQVKENPELKKETERVFGINLNDLPNDILDLSLYNINNINHLTTLISMSNSFNEKNLIFGETYETITTDNNKIKFSLFGNEIKNEVSIMYEIWDVRNFYFSFNFLMTDIELNEDNEYSFEVSNIIVTNKNDETINITDRKTIDNLYFTLESVLDDQLNNVISDMVIDDNYRP